jgi:hypothetical protein
MAELGGIVEYLYWSERRTSRFIEDNGLSIPQVTHTVTAPSFRWLPAFSRTATNPSNLRAQKAMRIEQALGAIAVTRFDGPRPIKYAKGVGTVVFGEFISLLHPPRQPAVILTVMDYDRRDRDSVALCLYGSMDNFPEYIQSAGPCSNGDTYGGWVASSAQAVFHFIRSHGQIFNGPIGPVQMALDALQIADGQGMYKGMPGGGLGMDRPWERAFTYGDAQRAEWLAQIYLDVDLETDHGERVDGFRRVLVGAPLWIRTPRPRAIRLYATCDDPWIVAERDTNP